MIAVKSFLHPVLLCKNKLCIMLCRTYQAQTFCSMQLCKSQIPGTALAGLGSRALSWESSLPWKAGSLIGSTSAADLTYRPLISFHLASVREKGLAPAKSTFHTLRWMCEEPFFITGPPMSLPGPYITPSSLVYSHCISSKGLYKKALFPR